MSRAAIGWSALAGVALSSSFALLGCGDSEGDGSPGSGGAGATGGSGAAGGAGATGGTGGSGECGPDGPAPNETLDGTADPHGGSFTMDEALEGLPMGDGPLRAILTTELGEITCELFPNDAPNAVANFVGLARGRRAFREPGTGAWVRRAFYDGLIFHRVIDDFMAQGGDPLGTGTGGPGYQLNDEISTLLHQAGTLAYANSGPNTNGSQFYITEVVTDWLDGDYTIFGQCEPMTVIQALTAVPVGANDKPVTDVHTESVVITRCAVE